MEKKRFEPQNQTSNMADFGAAIAQKPVTLTVVPSVTVRIVDMATQLLAGGNFFRTNQNISDQACDTTFPTSLQSYTALKIGGTGGQHGRHWHESVDESQ